MSDLLSFILDSIGQCKAFFVEFYPMCIGLCVIATVPCIVRKAVRGK